MDTSPGFALKRAWGTTFAGDRLQYELQGDAFVEGELDRISQNGRGDRRVASGVVLARVEMSVPRKPTDPQSSPAPETSSDASPETSKRGPDLPPPDLPPHDLPQGLAGLRALMDRLLAPDGCPWDRKQTLDSLRPYLLEETHEVLDAMDDPVAHRAELGDLLFQIVFQSALREREGAFDLGDVIDGIRDKMVRRHPHVFVPPGHVAEPTSPEAVQRQWETIKRAERSAAQGERPAGPDDPLAGVPKTMPALMRASKLQDKAAALGFDWPDLQGALDKFDEEWAELTEARQGQDPEAIREEMGDLLFVLCRIAGKLSVDPEDALRCASAKFERRFAHVLQRCYEGGVDPTEAGLARLDGWWNEAKKQEH